VILQEPLPYVDDAWLSGPEGSHVAELVVPLRLNKVPPDSAASVIGNFRRYFPSIKQEVRRRPPGSEWVFLKLYGPPMGEDAIITGALLKLCRSLPSDVSWYFLRYADPRPHLRIRFHSEIDGFSSSMTGELSRWATDLMEQGRCESFCFDVYEREVERYGGPSVIGAAEAAFCADSGLAVHILASRPLCDSRVLGVFTIDRLLGKLELKEEERLSWLRQFVNLGVRDGVAYREKKGQFVECLKSPTKGLYSQVAEYLERSKGFTTLVNAIKSAETKGELTTSRSVIYQSLVHMHCNRLWGIDAQRELDTLRMLRRSREHIVHL